MIKGTLHKGEDTIDIGFLSLSAPMVGLLILGTTLTGNPVLPLVTKELVPPGKLIS